MELQIIGCGLGRRSFVTKKIGLTEKITEYISLSLLPTIVPEDLATFYKTNLSSVLRVLNSLKRKNIVSKSGSDWVRSLPPNLEE